MKKFFKWVLFKLGYQLRRCHKSLHIDPYFDQEYLLKGARVETIFDLGANVGQSAAEYRAWLIKAGLTPLPVVPTLIHCGVLAARV